MSDHYPINPRLLEIAQQKILDRLSAKLAESATQRELQEFKRRESQAIRNDKLWRDVHAELPASREFQPLKATVPDAAKIKTALVERVKTYSNKRWTSEALSELLIESEIAKRAAEFRLKKFEEIDERLAALEGRSS